MYPPVASSRVESSFVFKTASESADARYAINIWQFTSMSKHLTHLFTKLGVVLVVVSS